MSFGKDSSARFLTLGVASKLINSSYVKNVIIGDYSCVNRSALQRYINIGMFSYICDTETGSYCSFGSRVSIGGYEHPTDRLTTHEFSYRDMSNYYDESLPFRPDDYQPGRRTIIGSDVWVGNNVCIKAGVFVGDGVIIGQGSVVTKNVPSFSVVAGNPSRVIRYRFDDQTIRDLCCLKWWNFDIGELKSIDFTDISNGIEQIKKLRRRQERS